VSILGVSGPTASGAARLRPEQRGTVERLNGLASNLWAPTALNSRGVPIMHRSEHRVHLAHFSEHASGGILAEGSRTLPHL
jgi:hypothetical protein